MKTYTILKQFINASNAHHRGNPAFVLIFFTGINLSIPLNLNKTLTFANRLMALHGVPFSPLLNPIVFFSAKGVFMSCS